MMGIGHGSGWGWLFGALLLVGLVLLTVVVVRLVAGGMRPGDASGRRVADPADDRRSARRLLDERYARGEISTEEYQERRRVLDGGH